MREKAASNLDTVMLVKFSFSLKEKDERIEWEEELKEFRYKDEMYDVVKAVVYGDSVTYFCLHDKDEGTLISNFDSLVKNNLNDNEKTKNNTIKELSKYNFTSAADFYPVFNKLKLGFCNYFFYESLSIEIQSPPPETVC